MSGARAGKAPPHEATAGGDESDGEEPDDDEFHQEELREEDEEDRWVGRVLNNLYEVVEKIGEGGMGAVYRARHVHLDKHFAIKVLVPLVHEGSLKQRDSAVARLRQEAMASARIDHDHIVEVVSFDETDDGAVYIVMEFLEGESLAERLERGPIGLKRAVSITLQVCDALDAAHRHEIVHRDLKPENIYLSEKRGRTLVKVLDFGISKVKSADAERVRMTKTGQMIGTPLYMSPEQARGETDVDGRADIYATGVILFEMLAGLPPFSGRNYFELLWKHGNEEAPTLRAAAPDLDVPDELERLIARTLAKLPGDRFSTMAELEAALRRAVPALPPRESTHSLPPDTVVAERAVKRSGEGVALANTLLDTSRSSHGTQSLTLPTTSRAPLVLTACAVVLGLGALALFGTGEDEDVPAVRREEAVTAETSAEAARVEPAPIAANEAPAPEPSPPPGVTVELASVPSGVSVELDGQPLGVTPLVAVLEVGTTPSALRFSKAGYRSRTLRVLPAEGLEVPLVRLRRVGASAASRRGATSLPIKGGL